MYSGVVVTADGLVPVKVLVSAEFSPKVVLNSNFMEDTMEVEGRGWGGVGEVIGRNKSVSYLLLEDQLL